MRGPVDRDRGLREATADKTCRTPANTVRPRRGDTPFAKFLGNFLRIDSQFEFLGGRVAFTTALFNTNIIVVRKLGAIFLFLATAGGIACHTGAAPISISNRPASINDRPTTNIVETPSKPIGEMTWTNDAGEKQTLGELKGKAVILDFWATNCPPCREEIPHLNSLLARYGGDKLAIYGMHVGDAADKAEIPNFVAQTKLDYPIVYPEKALTSFIFASTDAIPQTLIIDRNGQIVKKVVGFSDRVKLDLDLAVETAVNSN